MEYTWDPAKSDENFRTRGFDFAFAAQVFGGAVVEYIDDRRDYGEVRRVAVGLAEGIPLTVVFTDRERRAGRVIRRIISARVSSRKERARYAKAIEVR